MNRILIFLLVLYFVLGSYTLASASSYDSEIRFRGLEWSCSIDDAVKNIQAAGVESSKIESDYDVHFFDYSTSVDKSGFSYSPHNLPDNFYVAGHLVEQVCAYAIYGIIDGEISKNSADSKLYKGTYYFKTIEDSTPIYDDLVAKLTDIYGVPSEHPDSYSDHALIWYGLNNTAVTIEFDDGSYPLLHIDYWDLDCYDLIIEMQSVAYTGDLSSVDGL